MSAAAERRPAERRPAERRPGRTTATRQKLFDAAMQLIGDRGPAGVTVDEIAAAAGVAKGTVYYNFTSKADLIGQLLRHGVNLMDARLRASAAAQDPLTALEAMIGAAIDFLAEYPSFAQLWMGELWRTPSQWHATLTELREQLLGTVAAAVQRIGEAHTVDRSVPADGVVTAIFGATFVVGLDRAVFHPERSREAAVAGILTIMRGYLVHG